MTKNKLILSSILCFSCFTSLFSCNSNNTVIITIENEDENKGTISAKSITAAKGNLVKITASPKDNYLFTGWYQIKDKDEFGVYFDTTYVFEAKEDIKLKAKWENYNSKQFVFEEITEGEYKGTYKIGRYFGSEQNIIVPSSHHGRAVTTIALKTFIGIDCQEIFIPEGITSIENYAFKECSAQYVTLPNSLIKLGNHPFTGWKNNQILRLHKNSFNNDKTKTTWGWDINYDDKLILPHSTASESQIKFEVID